MVIIITVDFYAWNDLKLLFMFIKDVCVLAYVITKFSSQRQKLRLITVAVKLSRIRDPGNSIGTSSFRTGV